MKPKRFLGRTDTHSIIWCPFFSLLFFFFWKPNNTCDYIMLSWRDITQAASVCVVYSHYEEKAWLMLQNVHQKWSTEYSHMQTIILMSEAKRRFAVLGLKQLFFSFPLSAPLRAHPRLNGKSSRSARDNGTLWPDPPPSSMMVSQPTDNHHPSACQT